MTHSKPGYTHHPTFLAWLLLAVPLCCAAGDARKVEQNLPAGVVEMVDVHVSVGELLMVTGRSAEIEVAVLLAPAAKAGDADEEVSRAIAGARVVNRAKGGWLYLEIVYPVELRQGLVEEYWLLRLPAAVGAEVEMAVGDIRVEGLAGGIDLQLGMGDIDVVVPGGSVRAIVSVGKIVVRTSTDSPGDIALSTRAGHSSLALGGRQVSGKRAHGPGSRITHAGDGEDRIELMADIGDVSVSIRKIP